MQASKTKRVFQLRKTGSVRPNTNQQAKVAQQQEQQRPPSHDQDKRQKQQTIPNDSFKYEGSQPKMQESLTSYPDITIDQHELHFNQKIGNVQVKNIKIKNVGSSAIYYQWNFKNLPKINQNAIKDPKPNFYCHYQPNVIKPGEQAIFSFSFFSETPGVFIQQVSLNCQPQPATPVSPIKLKGVAYIEDKLKNNRQSLQKQVKEKITEVFTRQVLQDLVCQVKSPVPPLPDVSNPSVAQKQFQQKNANQKLYYNTQVHKWFTSLYLDICNALQIPEEKRHWDQSVSKLVQLISSVKDSNLKIFFTKRLQNYKSLSSTKPPQKSDLFPKIKDILLNTGYLLGGNISDQSKKQLQMWQIPFQQPNEAQTEQQVAAKKDERTKIIAEWAKKMKKKKWGPDEENQMLKNYRQKLQKGTSKALIQKLSGFDNEANYQVCKAKIKQKFQPENYFGFLHRLKTVQQFPIQGKKILLKFDLKLRQNSENVLIQLQQYLKKKKEQELRIEEEKKNLEANKAKKKAPVAKKKKGQKQEEQTKVLSFDFNKLLDQQSWQGLVNTLKFVIEKQPLLLIIGISYGPKTGVYNEKFSVKFLLECLKNIEPSVEFLQHKDLFELKTKIEEQTLNEGAIYLTQNLSFLPCEGMEKGEIKKTEKVENGENKVVESIVSHKMLMSEVEKEMQILMPAIDIIVREDRFVNRISGISSYGNKISILGTAWWKYISFALRTQKAQILLGGEFTPQKLVLLAKLARYCKKIYLAGSIGLIIWIVSNGINSYLDIKLSKTQQEFIKQFLNVLKQQQTLQRVVLPLDVLCQSTQQGKNEKIQIQLDVQNSNLQNKRVIDIGTKTCSQFEGLQFGHFFIIEHPSIRSQSIFSLQKIGKILYLKKQLKKQRHMQQQSAPAGINYEKDLVVYFIGVSQEQMEKIELKQKKKRQQGEEQEEEDQPQQQQNQVKKIDQICDFRLINVKFFQSLLSASYSYGLKDIEKYPKSD